MLQHRFTILLASLILLLLVIPMASLIDDWTGRELGQTAVTVAYLLILMTAVLGACNDTRHIRIAMLIAVPAIQTRAAGLATLSSHGALREGRVLDASADLRRTVYCAIRFSEHAGDREHHQRGTVRLPADRNRVDVRLLADRPYFPRLFQRPRRPG